MKQRFKTMKIIKVLFPLWMLLLSGVVISGCNSQTEPETQTENHANAEEPGSEETQHTEEESEHSGEVHLSEQQRQSLGINVETLEAGSASSTITRPAGITYDLDNIAKVGPRIEAKVVRMLKDLGDRVGSGEPIALMSSVELGKAKAEYIRLKARLKSENARYKREQSLYEQNISSEAELLEAEATFEEAQAELNATAEELRLYGLSDANIQNIQTGSDQPFSRFYLTSPISGMVQERNLSPGQTISPTETPIHIANLSELWVMIDAYEQDIQYIEEGQTVSLSVRSIPNATFKGTLDWISYALEEGSRTMPVRANIKNPDGQLRSGMFGTARIQTGKERNIAVIPVDAVQTIEGEPKVFVPGDEAGSFRAVGVTLGAENEGLVEITSGLQPGDKAVTGGAFDLKSALTSSSRSADH